MPGLVERDEHEEQRRGTPAASEGVLSLRGTRLTVTLPDPFDFTSHTRFREFLVAAQAQAGPVVSLVLDFSRVTAIDSAGLGLLLIARDIALGLGWSIELAGASTSIARVFLHSGFDALFVLHLTEPAELRRCAQLQ